MSMCGFEMLNFNVDRGYLKAIIRGYQWSLLTSTDYNNLCEYKTLDGVKMHLGATDYGPYLANASRYFYDQSRCSKSSPNATSVVWRFDC